VSAAEILVVQLAGARRKGAGFADAWPDALAAALASVRDARECREWTTVLAEMVETWRAAFERRPAARRERALRAVADDPDREPLDDADGEPCGRRCEHCDAAIPDDRDPRTIYCSDRCRKNAHYARTHMVAA